MKRSWPPTKVRNWPIYLVFSSLKQAPSTMKISSQLLTYYSKVQMSIHRNSQKDEGIGSRGLPERLLTQKKWYPRKGGLRLLIFSHLLISQPTPSLSSSWTHWSISPYISIHSRLPIFSKLIRDSQIGSSQISNAKLLHVFDCYLFVSVDIECLEEWIHVFFLGIVVWIKHSVGVCQNRHRLILVICYFDGIYWTAAVLIVKWE